MSLKNLLFPKKVQKFEQGGIEIINPHGTSVFRRCQNQFLRERVSNLPDVNTVLNVGAVQSDIDKEGGRYQDYFPKSSFFTLDVNRPEPHPNHLVLNLHDLEKLSLKFDLVLCMSTLEHVENPFLVADELQKILNPGGYIYLTVPFFYPYHPDANGKFEDFWRFSKKALLTLFSRMNVVWIEEMPSVIKVVEDRHRFWGQESTFTGIGALFQK